MINIFPNSNLSSSMKAAIVCLLISLVGFIGSTFINEVSLSEPKIQPIVSKSLKFEDQYDGAVRVIDARSNQIIEVIEGEAGFVRGVLRTISRERRMRGIGSEQPILLNGYQDGRIILKDPLTNTSIELMSFGRTNAQAFQSLLHKEKTNS